MAMNIWRVFTF